MLQFIARKLASMVLTVLAVSILIFVLLEMNGAGVAGKVLGPYATDEQRMLWLEANGYLRPAFVRYFEWLGRALVGDFGESLRFKVPVAEILMRRLSNTAVLAFWAMLFIVVLGVVFGIIAGMREGSPTDRTLTTLAVVTTSVPEFASAVLLTSLFVHQLHWLPGTSGMTTGFDPKQLILPTAVLVLYGFGYITRMTRASMVEVMQQPYIRTATLKGLPRRKVILGHALRNALIAPFTVIVLQINWLLSGVVVVEYCFSYKGFGALVLEAALNQDIYLLQGCAMVAVLIAVVTQVIADIGYTYLNPRISIK
jgi:peptide/nickel transport system permease protein